jgi:hypothetical protein
LWKGGLARVSLDVNLFNRVRAAPALSAEVIGELGPGTVMQIVDGPVCADGYVWWQVEHSSLPGGKGWTAEGDFQAYFLEPLK